jgi:diketogulonate reductase-like aldo/keto reductase
LADAQRLRGHRRRIQAAEQVLADGRARAIGVCNHKPRHHEALIGRTDVVPSVNQVELHPYFTQRATRDADARHGIVTQSWSAIGGVNVRARLRTRRPVRLTESPAELVRAGRAEQE